MDVFLHWLLTRPARNNRQGCTEVRRGVSGLFSPPALSGEGDTSSNITTTIIPLQTRRIGFFVCIFFLPLPCCDGQLTACALLVSCFGGNVVENNQSFVFFCPPLPASSSSYACSRIVLTRKEKRGDTRGVL